MNYSSNDSSKISTVLPNIFTTTWSRSSNTQESLKSTLTMGLLRLLRWQSTWLRKIALLDLQREFIPAPRSLQSQVWRLNKRIKMVRSSSSAIQVALSTSNFKKASLWFSKESYLHILVWNWPRNSRRPSKMLSTDNKPVWKVLLSSISPEIWIVLFV